MPMPTPPRIAGFTTLFLIAILGLWRMYTNLDNPGQLPPQYPSVSITMTDSEWQTVTADGLRFRVQYIPTTSLSQTSTMTASEPSIQLRQAQPSSTMSSQTNTITAPAKLLNQNPACCLLSSAIELCTSLTPYFMALPQMSQAECLCFSSTSYNPSIFDGAVSSCALYASTAVSAAWNALNDLEEFCGRASPYLFPTSPSTSLAYLPSSTLSAYITLPALITPLPASTTMQFGNQQCSIVQNIILGCVNQTPGFLTLFAPDQASCLCSSTLTLGSGAETGFDNAAKGCLSALNAGGSAALSVALRSFLGGDGGLCGQYSGQGTMTVTGGVGGNGTLTGLSAVGSASAGTGGAAPSRNGIGAGNRTSSQNQRLTAALSSTFSTDTIASQTAAVSSSTPSQTQTQSTAASSTFTSTTHTPPTFTSPSTTSSPVLSSLSTTASLTPTAHANDGGLRIVGTEQVVVISFLCAVLGMGTFLS